MNKFFNQALRLLLITNGLVLLAAAMLGPIYALFVEEIGGDLLEASLTGGIFALAAGITTLIAGRYTDKLKENNSLIVSLGYTVMGIGFFFFFFHFLFYLFCSLFLWSWLSCFINKRIKCL